MGGKPLGIRCAIDRELASVEVLVDSYASPTTSRTHIFIGGEVEGRAILHGHYGIDPVGMVAVISVATIGSNECQLAATLGNVDLYVGGIACGEV